MRILLILLLGHVAFSAQANNDFSGSIYCETGDPSGGGPSVDFEVTESADRLTADVALRVNSIDPQFGQSNVYISRSNLSAQNSGTADKKIWVLPVSRKYRVRLTKELSGDHTYWMAHVESANNKFQPIELGCQAAD